MKLSDLYKSTVEKSDNEKNKFEVINSEGEKTGHHIYLKPITDQDVVTASHKFNRLVNIKLKEFKAQNEALFAECEAAQDFREWNHLWDMASTEINEAYACELVAGWDFDNEFSEAALREIVADFRTPREVALAKQIIDAKAKQVSDHLKK